MKGKYLITTDSWFYAPNGKPYKAVWGEVEVLEDVFLGIKTNRNSTNWFLKVGNAESNVVIAGCQIHYAVKCETMPNTEPSEDWLADAQNGIRKYERPTTIYIPELENF